MKTKPMKPITLSAEQYWKLRTQLLQVESFKTQAEQQLRQLQDGVHASMRAAGLDPNLQYQLDDQACSATPQEAPR